MNDSSKINVNTDNFRQVYYSVKKTGWLTCLIILLVLVADQALKIWVKTSFYYGEGYEIFPWFQLRFIENNGMAFGMTFINKLVLSFGRIFAVGILVWLLHKLIIIGKEHYRLGFIIAMALITAGAAGNIIDCVFYGEIFNNPAPPEVATLFPIGGGYSGWFEGRVVDMLYFPFFRFVWPEWVPGIGGSEFEFFQYIFNIADSSICVGVAMLILFYSREASEAWKTLVVKDKK